MPTIHPSMQTYNRVIETYAAGYSLAETAVLTGVSPATVRNYTEKAGIKRTKSEGQQLRLKGGRKVIRVESKATKPKRVGVTWRKLEEYERTMPFQQALKKVLLEWTQDPGPTSQAEGGLEEKVRLTDGRRR